MAIRKHVLFSVGGFNPDGYNSPEMLWYRGDGEYGLLLKIREKGLETWYSPFPEIEHIIPKDRLSINQLENLVKNHSVSRVFTFARKHKCQVHWLFLLMVFTKITSIPLKMIAQVYPSNTDTHNVFHLRALKYLTMATYASKLLSDNRLRLYVMKPDYFS